MNQPHSAPVPGPLFFVSYAHSRIGQPAAKPRAPDRLVVQFFEDLTENVAWMVSRVAGQELGFLDRSSIRSGTRWSDELLHALSTCQVLVALLSGPYATCRWCAMEWHAVSQRSITRSSGSGQWGAHQTPIFPVIWAPFPEERTPGVIRKVQRFSPAGFGPDLVAKYERLGVLGIVRTEGYDNAYRSVVWALAQGIADFYHSAWVEPCKLRQEELRDVFAEEEP